MKNDLLYVCYATSEFYARETGISMTGFFENNPTYEPNVIFILDYGLNPLSKEFLDRIAHRYLKHIEYLPALKILHAIQKELNLSDFRGSLATYSRAFIDKIIPEYVNRLFYIDSDTVVIGSIYDLNYFEMNESCIAGVVSPEFTSNIRKGKWKLYSNNNNYYGCGVVLYNIKNWRAQNCYDKICQLLKKKTEYPCADQTLINNALPESCFKKLPLKYNYTTHLFGTLYEKYFLKSKKLYDSEEINDAIIAPIVVHYPGNPIDRPWFEGCTSRRCLDYYAYKKMTPWVDDSLQPLKNSNNLNMQHFIHKMQITNSLFPVILLINCIRQTIGPILRVLKILPNLPKEGIE